MTDGVYDSLLYNWDRLQRAAKTLHPGLEGEVINIVACPFDTPIYQGSKILVRAYVASSVGDVPQPDTAQKVVLVLRSSDWLAVDPQAGPLHVLAASVSVQSQQYLLDCTGISSVVVTCCNVLNDTCVHMAEIFSGGFSGWSQAAYILHTAGIPVQTSWTLDVDGACSDMLCHQHASWAEASDLESLLLAGADGVLHLCADVQRNWWLRVFRQRPVHIVCISAPCQPWSSAGSEQGLSSEDGLLLLRAADIVGLFQIPLVLLEQVAHFTNHPHFATVMHAWSLAGYVIQWQASLNLLDVLPSQRQRFLMVLSHRTNAGHKQLQPGSWTIDKRINLGQAKVLFDLPPTMLDANTPSQDVLDMYMDPWYVPTPRHAHHSPPSPQKFRIKTAADTAGVFVAQYQFQHELPPAQLQKGIHGCLLRKSGLLRFFSGPEIAAVHGAAVPIFLAADQREQMKLLGNCIAVPHAMVPLVCACSLLGVSDVPEPAAAVALCLRARLHNANSLLMPFGPDWVLCHRSQVDAVLQTQGRLMPRSVCAPAPEAFVEVLIRMPAYGFKVSAPPDCAVLPFFDFLGCPEVASCFTGAMAEGLQSLTVHVQQPLELNCGGFVSTGGTKHGLALILSDAKTFVVELHTARAWSQLFRVFQEVAPGSNSLALFATTGQRLLTTEQFSACMVAVAEDEEVPIFPLRMLVPVLPGLQVARRADELQVQVAAEVALDAWLAMPFHLVHALGWSSEEENFPPRGPTPSCCHLRQARHPCMPADLMHEQWRLWLLTAQLDALASLSPTDSIASEVQVVARCIWTGRLPAATTLAELSDFWGTASRVCGLGAGHRVFSGPHPHVPETSLQELRSNASACVVRRSGHLLLTYHPEVRGGGVKAENLSWAQTRAASLCLSKGFDLACTTAFVDQLSNAVGAQRLSSVLQDSSQADRWQALVELATTAGVAVPQSSNLPAKAANRAIKAAQRRKTHDRRTVQADEVCLTADFFLNEDGTPATLLDEIRPGVSGVKLVGEPEAQTLIHTLRGVQPDELGLLVLGHSCPCPDDCNGQLCFPATSRANGSRLLLAGCLHNLGGKRVRTKDNGDITVALPDMSCCTFECYADEFEPEIWSAITQAPVRAVLDRFRKGGIDKPFSDPWGRAFSQNGRPAIASLADRVCFQARVLSDSLDQLLIASGHNHVYCTPRNMDRTVVQSYAIVWLGNARGDAVRAALQTPEQLGLVRAKTRFGLRVPAARFAAIFASLRPGQMVPNKVAVNQLYRVGPLPQTASAEAIVDWATKAGWQVRVIKALGARHWLLGASAAPPSVYPAFNGQTILVNAVSAKPTSPPVVQSGHLGPRAVAATPRNDNTLKPEDPWVHFDPWRAAATANSNGATASSRPSFGSVATSETPSRSLAGPTEQRFQAQESRLHALEEGLEQLRLRQEANHTELVQSQADDREAAARLSVESLKGSQLQQQQQTQASLEELKFPGVGHLGFYRPFPRSAVVDLPPRQHFFQLACPASFASELAPFLQLPPAPTSLWQLTMRSLLVSVMVKRFIRDHLFLQLLLVLLATVHAHLPSRARFYRHRCILQTATLPPVCIPAVLADAPNPVPRCLSCFAQSGLLPVLQQAQRIVSSRLRSTGFSWVWGAAVPPHHAETCRSDSLRGHAAGVAIASLFPVRLPFQPLECTGVAAHRLVLGHVRFGPLHARLIVVYGWPANHSAAKAKNETLFQEVLQSVAGSPLPTIVGGDFNTDVTKLPCWPEFQRLGYAELSSFCASRFGQQLPPTCRNSTRHDSVLLPRVFQPLLQKASVDVECHLFDSHAPVLLEFCLPQHNPCKQVWRKPTSWMEFEPDADLAQRCYIQSRAGVQQSLDTCASREDLDAAFAQWASVLETSVDFAVQQAHCEDPLRCPVARLPRRAKGRCVYRDVKAQALPVTAPNARCGDYSPPDEALSHRSRHKVKQEWAAIQAARGYPPCFGQWLLQVAHFVEAYDTCPAAASSEGLPAAQCLFEYLPPDDWLRDVSDFVRYECDAVIRQEQHQRRLLHSYQAAQDASTGLRQGYRSIRPSENPPFTSVPVEECQHATLDCCAKDGWGLYRVPAPEFFCAGCPAVADDQAVQVGACQQDDIFGPRLWLHFAQQPLPMSCKLCQATEAVTARELHRCFTNFWHPLWNRDQGPAATDLDCWTSFITSLPAPPPECNSLQLQLDDPAFWQQHLRNLKPRSATGYCGFSNQELRWLPSAPLEDLVRLFTLCSVHGWPKHLARATVSTLAKVSQPLGMQHGRPITVFANLYRLWASGVAKAVLEHWSSWLPRGVMGSVPGRSVRDLSLALECQIELHLLASTPFAGFSIDVVKCFNQLPRVPLRFLLAHLGFPEPVLHAWFDWLDCCHRLPVFHGSIGPPVLSCTGMPEGCPLSVVAQVAVCWAAQVQHMSFGAEQSSYVDNFTWTGTTVESLTKALITAQGFCSSLALPIDWTKSFAWSTDRKLRQWLAGPAQQLLPPDSQLAVVQSAKDLGVAFKFRRLNSLDAAAKRLAEGHRRLTELQRPGVALLHKARIIQTSIWPATFYGFEARLLSSDRVCKLRTGACRALIGPRPSASPLLTLSVLTPQITDPEVYLLCQALLALQRMMFCRPELAHQWLAVTTAALVSPQRPIGPATALAGLLRRNDWSLDVDGTAKGPGNTCFNLLTDPPRMIRAALRTAWLDLVPAKVRDRNGLQRVQCPAPDICHRILARFPDGLQVHLAQSAVGGFMSNAARATWDPLQCPQCDLCGMLDSKHHRLLECPIAAPLRRMYQPLLDWVLAEQPHWLHCPFPTAHEDEGFLRLFWRSRRMIAPNPQAHLRTFLPAEVHLFTDGSCQRPEVPAARHAAWAVIMYAGHDPPDLAADIPFWKQHGLPPPYWHVVAQGCVPGRQDINRAECCALFQALQVAAELEILAPVLWSDSQNALRAVAAASKGAAMPRDLSFCADLVPDNLDVLVRGATFHKVKAHQQLPTCLQDGQSWSLVAQLGDAIADEAAKTALRNDLAIADETCARVAHWRVQQADYFYLFCQYLVQLTLLVVPARREDRSKTAQALSAATAMDPACSWLGLQPSLEFATVQVLFPEGWEQRHSEWPQWYTSALFIWLQQLRWPTCLPPDRTYAGTTFFELLINFVITTGFLPPVRSQTCGQWSWTNLLEATGVMLPVVVREMIVQLISSIDRIRKMDGIEVWPSPRHHKIRSLQLCDQGSPRKGLLYRPWLPSVQFTSTALQSVLSSDCPGECLREIAWRVLGKG
ncbi:unnamed protein product [Symbiodinium necroappetens]|uniref:RNase H type-1 domain-containing protein n=1 Tax=Symbiodinium necroappetens TaxID=1628268 RepID=A0A812PMV4_9DINO|nr:unnamed protein product [Symbiodinium necroappetens]